MIVHLNQPQYSSTCGQHCLAMLFRTSVEQVCTVMGKYGGTRTRDLSKFLNKWGITTGARLEKIKEVPNTAILHIRFYNTNKSYWGHWALLFNGTVYDPGHMTTWPMRYDVYVNYILSLGGKVTSYLRLGDEWKGLHENDSSSNTGQGNYDGSARDADQEHR